jgi:hypothetical protein
MSVGEDHKHACAVGSGVSDVNEAKVVPCWRDHTWELVAIVPERRECPKASQFEAVKGLQIIVKRLRPDFACFAHRKGARR